MRAASRSALVAARLGVSRSQVCVPVIGGDAPGASRVLDRYVTVAGIPARELGEPPAGGSAATGPVPAGETALVSAVAVLARAVIEDRREVLSCACWVQDALGIPGGFVCAPVRIGARGAEEPLALRLTLEERAFLQRHAVT